MNDDWRLFRGQEKYLHGVTLIQQSYKPKSPYNDHDHCEFCMDKFGQDRNDLDYGYSTEDNDIWICSDCYNDFKEMFKWTVKNS